VRTCALAGLGLAIMAIANAADRSAAEDERVARAVPRQRAEPP
jgi:hypothetical protein